MKMMVFFMVGVVIGFSLNKLYSLLGSTSKNESKKIFTKWTNKIKKLNKK